MDHRWVALVKASESGKEIIVSLDQPRAGSVRSAFRSAFLPSTAALVSPTHSESQPANIVHFMVAAGEGPDCMNN